MRDPKERLGEILDALVWIDRSASRGCEAFEEEAEAAKFDAAIAANLKEVGYGH